jgi:hypothetical protein
LAVRSGRPVAVLEESEPFRELACAFLGAEPPNKIPKKRKEEVP